MPHEGQLDRPFLAGFGFKMISSSDKDRQTARKRGQLYISLGHRNLKFHKLTVADNRGPRPISGSHYGVFQPPENRTDTRDAVHRFDTKCSPSHLYDGGRVRFFETYMVFPLKI